MINIKQRFSKASTSYNSQGFIQRDIAENLIKNINITELDRIVDIGAGTGIIWELLKKKPDNYISIDFSKEMLEKHTDDIRIKKICENFDNNEFWELLKDWKPTKIISSSALQWSSDIKKIFENLNNFTNSEIYLSIFTNKTFVELHEYLNILSPIPSIEKIINTADRFNYKIKKYELEFLNSIDLLRYIRESGVSGSVNKADLKLLMRLRETNSIKKISIEVIYLYKNIN